MNPQLNVLKQHNLLIPFEQEVLRVASNNWQSSHEFKNLLKTAEKAFKKLHKNKGYKPSDLKSTKEME